jgi:L-threonine 3-dehydrogenase (EC 1.1.1.103)
LAMPDAIRALLELADAPREALTQAVYNVTAFSLSAQDVADIVAREFPGARISFAPTPGRQNIVDSWPADIDDSAARRDWGWQPAYDAERAFHDYLIPTIRRHYEQK